VKRIDLATKGRRAESIRGRDASGPGGANKMEGVDVIHLQSIVEKGRRRQTGIEAGGHLTLYEGRTRLKSIVGNLRN